MKIDNTHQSWLIASNPSKYDAIRAFKSTDTITWGLTTNPDVGDKIYIYVSAPYSSIQYACVVDRIKVPITERLGTEFWIEPFDPNRNLVNLKLERSFADSRLELRALIDNGLIASAPQGPRRVGDKLQKLLDTL